MSDLWFEKVEASVIMQTPAHGFINFNSSNAKVPVFSREMALRIVDNAVLRGTYIRDDNEVKILLDQMESAGLPFSITAQDIEMARIAESVAMLNQLSKHILGDSFSGDQGNKDKKVLN